jgi:hypothetical protein
VTARSGLPGLPRLRAGWRRGTLPAGPSGPDGPAGAVAVPGGGQVYNAGGIRAWEILSPDSCGGALWVIFEIIKPGELVRAHRHHDVTQLSIVTGEVWDEEAGNEGGGELVFRVGTETRPAGRGGLSLRPPEVDHALWNPGPRPVGQYEISMRGDIMRDYFRRYGKLVEGGPAEPEVAAALAARYGITFNPELTRELELEHSVTAAPGGPLT